MTYKRFEDLPVWQAGTELALEVYRITDDASFNEGGDLVDQIRSASVSVSSNIAEGFERGTTPELLCFFILPVDRRETRSQLRFCLKRGRYKHLQGEIDALIPLAESCSKQIRAWTDSLQNSDIKGPRHLNDATREAFEMQRRWQAFMDKLKAMTKNKLTPPESEI